MSVWIYADTVHLWVMLITLSTRGWCEEALKRVDNLDLCPMTLVKNLISILQTVALWPEGTSWARWVLATTCNTQRPPPLINVTVNAVDIDCGIVRASIAPARAP